MGKGSGIVVLKKFGDNYKVLCLYGEDKKSIRTYDMTKGTIDKGEDPFDTAIRETYEEAGIRNVKFEWGKKSLDKNSVVMFVATTSDEPVIRPNPKSGVIEHDGFEWNEFSAAYVLMPNYLKPFITWAERISRGEKDVKI